MSDAFIFIPRFFISVSFIPFKSDGKGRRHGNFAGPRVEFHLDLNFIAHLRARRTQHLAVDIEAPLGLIFHESLGELNTIYGSADRYRPFSLPRLLKNLFQNEIGRIDNRVYSQHINLSDKLFHRWLALRPLWRTWNKSFSYRFYVIS